MLGNWGMGNCESNNTDFATSESDGYSDCGVGTTTDSAKVGPMSDNGSASHCRAASHAQRELESLSSPRRCVAT